MHTTGHGGGAMTDREQAEFNQCQAEYMEDAWELQSARDIVDQRGYGWVNGEFVDHTEATASVDQWATYVDDGAFDDSRAR